MQPYRLSYEQDDRKKPRDVGPPGKADNKWHGVREYWSRFRSGAFSADYEAGVQFAREDLEAGNRVNRDALKAVPGTDRDHAWVARRDGYLDTIGEGGYEARL